jgi:hypothetical protein
MTMHSRPTSLPTLHLLLIALAAAALLLQAPRADAQHASPPPSMSDKEKAKIQEKRAFQKDTEDAYQSTMSRLPDVKPQKVDPWGNMRAAPQK